MTLRALSNDRQPQEVGAVRLADEPPVRLGPLLIEPARRRMAHQDGREVVLEPRAMQVLVALLRARGEVVSQERLFETCWNGVVVGDDAISRAVSRLRASVAKVADGIIRIETVARVGHRIVVEIPSAPVADPGGGGVIAPLRRRRHLLPLALLSALVALGTGWWLTRPPAEGTASRTVGVVPFRGSGGIDVHLAGGLADQVRAD
ncbi:MAG: winged helix-turn-helix domain-containing protein, partial [Pseudomonadota bacterium]|nr:winged helix-turn-helix domain-containing protein [Pseudomonadota bacterium]